MKACTAGYALIYLATLKRHLVTSTVVGLNLSCMPSPCSITPTFRVR